MKSPCCDAELWDVEEDGEYIEGWLECSICGEQHDDSDVENYNDEKNSL